MEEHKKMFTQMKKAREEEGFTLIELLIAVVVVGILAAVVILGIGGLNNNAKKSACTVSLDAATAATAVYYSNNNGNYPACFAALVTVNDLDPASGTTVAAAAASPQTITHGSDWTLTMTGGGATAPAFACS
jgi:prepilin-type N-terminal cleavage/methylation domain-containing protein